MATQHKCPFKLCYIDDRQMAYFTTLELGEQRGDDWDNAPLHCNAGPPYMALLHGEDWRILRLVFEGPFESPASMCSSVSVDQVNAGRMPWLWVEGDRPCVQAGASPREFIEFVRENGGEVFTLFRGDPAHVVIAAGGGE